MCSNARKTTSNENTRVQCILCVAIIMAGFTKTKLWALCIEDQSAWWRHDSPGWFVEEHDGGIVDEFKGDRQSLALTAWQVLSTSVLCLEQTQHSENLVDLPEKTTSMIFVICYEHCTLCCATKRYAWLDYIKRNSIQLILSMREEGRGGKESEGRREEEGEGREDECVGCGL